MLNPANGRLALGGGAPGYGSCSPKRIKKARIAYGLLGNPGNPGSLDRFLIRAEACRTHDAYAALGAVPCPVRVIGETQGGAVTGEASRELAERVPGGELYMYEGLRHGLYGEAPGFWNRVMDFCR